MSFKRAIVAALFTFGVSVQAAAAQSAVTSADIERLQDYVYDVSRDVTQLRSRDSSLASDLQRQLDDLRDEAIYLKVKLRKSEPVTRSDYNSVRDRIEDVRARARGDSSRPLPPPPSRSEGSSARSNPYEVPEGTELDVRLLRTLSSKTAQPEDRFEATTTVDLRQGDRVLIPAGSVVRGIVSSVTKAGRVERKSSMSLAFDQITVSNRSHPIHATVTEAIEGEGYKGDVEKIGAGAGIGAIIGGILGGFKGAMAGILIGGGGVVAATEGQDVELPPGTVLRIRLDSPLNLR
jgi:hypothetical protein